MLIALRTFPDPARHTRRSGPDATVWLPEPCVKLAVTACVKMWRAGATRQAGFRPMPLRDPFTRLCQQTFALRAAGRADLHVHSTHSDGLFTPAEIVARARRAGLVAVALADHDTLNGYAEARGAAAGSVEVIPGVEITCEHDGQELHLLGYFVRPDDPALNAALERLRGQRAERFAEMAERLRGLGASVSESRVRDHLRSGA